MAKQKIRIRLKAFDYKLIDQNEINSYDRVVDATNLKEDLKVFIENRR